MPYTPREIMEGCFRGERVFINAFYEKYERLIYYAIHCWMRKYGVQSPDDVRDVFQGVFVKLLENNFALLRRAHDINRPAPLIFLIAKQYTARYFIKKGRDKLRTIELDENLVWTPDEQEELPAEVVRILEEAMDALDENQRNLLRLFYQDNLSYAEIAAETGLSATNVGAIISRAKRQMRNFIKRRYPEIPKIL